MPETQDTHFFLVKQIDEQTVRFADGSHDDPAGVARAAKIYQRIFGDDPGNYLMLAKPGHDWPLSGLIPLDDTTKLSPVPDVATVEINEDAAQFCAYVVAESSL